MACAYLLLSSDIFQLVNYVQIVNWLAIGIATASLLYLRIKMPVQYVHRPIKVRSKVLFIS